MWVHPPLKRIESPSQPDVEVRATYHNLSERVSGVPFAGHATPDLQDRLGLRCSKGQ